MKQTNKDIEARESGSEGTLAGLNRGEIITVCAWCDQGKTKGGNVSHGICEQHQAEMLEEFLQDQKAIYGGAK